MEEVTLKNAGEVVGSGRLGVAGEKLVFLSRGFPNFTRLDVNEIPLDEIRTARLKDSFFGCYLEIEKVTGETVSVRGLGREEAIRMAEILSEKQDDANECSDEASETIHGLLPDFDTNVKEIFRDKVNSTSRLVEFIIAKAIELNASDIHFEPLENLRIRFRIDGVLTDVAEIPVDYHARVASRVKVLAKLPTYEKDVPLDGRIEGDFGPRLDLRVSTFPTVRGDKVVIRIFDSALESLQLGELGLTGEVLKKFESLILRPEGTIILTGPSNSGKTTTIYSALEKIYAVKQNTVNIVTIEDPVERDLRKFSQTQIVPARGLTFSSALRSVLRQDPNVIVVGEIRDVETANMSIRAGMTGHLVITTIHSGTAPGALARLMEMGIEPFILASSVSGVMAQRLVRKVCPKCAVRDRSTNRLLERFRVDVAGFEQQKGEGCAECAGTGYRGRTAIAELMLVDDALREAVIKHSSIQELNKIAGASGMRGLLHDGLEKTAAGVTNLEELARVLVPDEG